jgi:glycerol-3-phosphate acyltransferase PlsX
MRLAVDVMGGDHAPDAILKGCVQAIQDMAPDEQLILIGDEPYMKDWLAEAGVKDPRLVIVHTTEVIGMDESPVEATRSKRNSSIVRMAELGSPDGDSVSKIKCDAVVSAGNTGACVAAATRFMRRLPGVHRPGIVVTIPTFHGPVELCDAGANPEPRPTHLHQYALMGDTVARQLNKKTDPRIGLINIGSEEGKGTDLIRATHELLKKTPGINYVGYVEGRDLFSGICDVVVTDGLVGNTLLKMAEGMASNLIKGICQEVIDADPDLMLRLEPIFKNMFEKNDYHEHGGAPLLGVAGICLIAHGSSEAKSIRAALKQCRKFVKSGINDAIVARIAEVEKQMAADLAATAAAAG